ncbi:MAG: 4-hydroxybenzoate decarboxylase [Planctomycetes bacterium]|jgi:UbiD family decarboxylase|nr:4-hydroxybenzoate decarboxylase [Planctomycetota bacterium]
MSDSAPRDLRTWLGRLQRAGQLIEVRAEVDADLEVAEIHRRIVAAGGPALLFQSVRNSPFSLATNLFGTRERVLSAFGPQPAERIEQLARLPLELVPPTLSALWKNRGVFRALSQTGMKRVRKAPIAEVIESNPQILSLPALKSWPRDGGRFLTWPLVYTEHPEHGGSNLGVYRMQLFDDAKLGLHIQIVRGAGFHLAAAEERNVPLPVVVNMGGPPAMILAALAPLPENVPEILLTGLLTGSKLRAYRHEQSPLPMFADGEFALVGQVHPGERAPEGPFGDHYGFYSETHEFPVFHCKTLFRRRAPILPATVVGKPRQEDFFLGDYLQELLTPLLKLAMPGVRSFWSYGETGYHSLGAAVVHERYRREAMATAFRILGEGQLSLTKFLMVTDGSIELRDFKATLTHILERTDFRTDLFLFSNLSMDTLDYAGPTLNEGGKGVLLGLGEARRKLPTIFRGEPRSGARNVRFFSPGCLVVEADRFQDDSDAAGRIAADPAFAEWPLIVVADDAERTAKSTINFLWNTFTRFDPGRDIHAAQVELIGRHASFSAPLAIDARVKPGYPDELLTDDATRELVDRRWSEYFPEGQEQGDSNRAHLD